MPYIPEDLRIEVNKDIDKLVMVLETIEEKLDNKIDGVLNYIFIRILDEMYDGSYYDYNRAMGLLSCVSNEFYRRKIAKYEDIATSKNGEVFKNM